MKDENLEVNAWEQQWARPMAREAGAIVTCSLQVEAEKCRFIPENCRIGKFPDWDSGESSVDTLAGWLVSPAKGNKPAA
jgi:hypothetical protein